MRTISRETLKERISLEKPNNRDRSRGYALVDIMDYREFVVDHIPGSIHIPKGEKSDFEARYDKSKEIILYGASPHCPVSRTVAEELVKRGFRNVYTYEGGLRDWKNAGNRLARCALQPVAKGQEPIASASESRAMR